MSETVDYAPYIEKAAEEYRKRGMHNRYGILKDAAAELVAMRERLQRLEVELAKSDPWNTNDDPHGDKFPKYHCIHCDAEYNMMAEEPKDTHKADCIWLAAALESK